MERKHRLDFLRQTSCIGWKSRGNHNVSRRFVMKQKMANFISWCDRDRWSAWLWLQWKTWKCLSSRSNQAFGEHSCCQHNLNCSKAVIHISPPHRDPSYYCCSQTTTSFRSSPSDIARNTHPAILLRRDLVGMIAASSQIRLFVWKSTFNRV